MRLTVKATLAFSIVVAGIVTAMPTAAQNYPTKPLRLVVPSAAGSGSDIQARLVANELTRQMGQQVVVDNRGGASSIVGLEDRIGNELKRRIAECMFARKRFAPCGWIGSHCLFVGDRKISVRTNRATAAGVSDDRDWPDNKIRGHGKRYRRINERH